MKGRVVERRSSADYVPNMAALVRQGYDVIIGVGFAQGAAVAKPRSAFRTEFAIVDVGGPRPAGERRRAALQGAGGRVPRGLPRGAVREGATAQTPSAPSAASRSRRSTGSSRATAPAPRRPCRHQEVGGYSSDWDDQAKCKELALNQIAAGSKVVFQVAGGAGSAR